MVNNLDQRLISSLTKIVFMKRLNTNVTNVIKNSILLQEGISMLNHFINRKGTSAHKGFTITQNVNYKCPRSVAAIALPVAAIALPQPPIYLKLT